jgi:hypothetical protein
MQPFDPTERLSVTLEAQQWNQLLGLLGEAPAPYRITNPLIQMLLNQLNPPEPASLQKFPQEVRSS